MGEVKLFKSEQNVSLLIWGVCLSVHQVGPNQFSCWSCLRILTWWKHWFLTVFLTFFVPTRGKRFFSLQGAHGCYCKTCPSGFIDKNIWLNEVIYNISSSLRRSFCYIFVVHTFVMCPHIDVFSFPKCEVQFWSTVNIMLSVPEWDPNPSPAVMRR